MPIRGMLSCLALSLLAAAPLPARAVGIDVGGRPFHLRFAPTLPTGYLPLVILLHGYSTTAAQQAIYFELAEATAARGMIFAALDGTRDGAGNQFWNGGACCQILTAPARPIEDVAYLDAVIERITRDYKVDPKRIYLIAHSNGSFLAHRYACERANIAAIVTVSGAQWNACPTIPPAPVSVAHIHATYDAVIRYYGTLPHGVGVFGPFYGPFNGAEETVRLWAERNGCSTTLPTSGPLLDLVATLPGAETKLLRFAGCPPGGAVELWKIDPGFIGVGEELVHHHPLAGHIPAFNKGVLASEALNWLLAHPKP